MTDMGGLSETDHFAGQYRQMSEGELMSLAAAYETLVEPAQDALRAEFAARGLEPPLLQEEQEVVDTRRLVTVRNYRDMSGAIVARSMLESAGLYCFLKDENLVRMDWQVSNFIGGMSLQVKPEDVEAARSLLDQPVAATMEIAGEPDYVQPHCPRCGSVEINYEGADRRAAIASVFAFGIPLPLGQKTWTCDACGARWTEDGE